MYPFVERDGLGNGPSESAPVLRAYMRRGYTEDYFEAGPDSPQDEFEAEAPNHSVFFVVGPTFPFRGTL